jgi:hypothetical protein
MNEGADAQDRQGQLRISAATLIHGAVLIMQSDYAETKVSAALDLLSVCYEMR